MAEKVRVILDTDVLIKAYRGDEEKIRNLILLKDHYCISVITAIELINGANTFRQLASFNKVLRIYSLIHISEDISLRAYKIFRQYSVKQNLGLADCFIAATSIKHNLQLYTDNKKDYNFIDHISFYEEK